MQFISSNDMLINYPGGMDNVTENYWRILDVNLAWIRQSDTKAYTIFMIYGISISVVFANIGSITNMLGNSIVVMLLGILYMITSLIAIRFGFRCIQPSLKLKFPSSIVFFGSIANSFISPEAYFEHSRQILEDPDKMHKELCNQIFINSIIARGKFTDINKSIKAFMASLVILLFIVLIYFF